MSTPVARAPQPTDAQLETMAHLINEFDGRKIGAIMRDVWDYVAGQIEAHQSGKRANRTMEARQHLTEGGVQNAAPL